MGYTKIDWAEKVWSPTEGCTKISAGCKFCHAERIHPRLFGSGPGSRPFSQVVMLPARLEEPLRWRKASRIFVSSRSDLFHEAVDEKYIAKVFAVCELAYWHTFLILTKRVQRMHDLLHDENFQFHIGWFASQAIRELKLEKRRKELEPHIMAEGTNNLWLGVSAENQEQADKRIPILLQTPAAVRWVSLEPLLGPVDLFGEFGHTGCSYSKPGLNWVVLGAESGPSRRPMKLDWALSLAAQCRAANIPFFCKQIHLADGKLSHRPEEWPSEAEPLVREFPS